MSPSNSSAARAEIIRLRRTNIRLRALIDAMKEDIERNRRDLSLQFRRIADLQVEVDTLKSAATPPRRTRSAVD